jgi:hypothetical protein
MKTLKLFGLAGGMVVAALVGGTLINAASASPTAPSTTGGVLPDDTDATAYCDAWRHAFADELGVSLDALTPAAKAAAIATIDQAVANGDVPSEIADRMKLRIENGNADGCRLLGAGFLGFGRHMAGVDWRIDWVSTAAEMLDLQPAELATDLRDGETLQEIADAQGVDYETLSQAILDAAEADLTALVDVGTITQDRADEVLANLADRLESGDFPPFAGSDRPMGPGRGIGPRHGPGNGNGKGVGNGLGMFSR